MTPNTYVPAMSKMEHLDRNNYKRWSERKLFYFIQIEVAYVLFMNPSSTEFARIARVGSAEIEITDGCKHH